MRQRVKGLLALFLVFAMVLSCQPSAVRAEESESISFLYMNVDPSIDGDSRFANCAKNVAFGTPLNEIADSIGVHAPTGYTIKGWKVWCFHSGTLPGEPIVYNSAAASISYEDSCNLYEQGGSYEIYAEAILEKPALEGTVTLIHEGEELETLRIDRRIEASADIVSPATPGALSYSFWRQTENGNEPEKIADGYRLGVEEEVGTVIWAEVTAENASGSIKSREYTVQKGMYSQEDVSLSVNDEYYSDDNGDRDTLNWWAPEYSEGKIQYRIKENGTWSDWTENIGTHDDSGAYIGSIVIGNVNRAVGDIEVREVDNDSYENRDPAYVWTNDEPFTAVKFSLTGSTRVGETLTANLVLDERNFSCVEDPNGTYSIVYTFKRGDVVVQEESLDATYTVTQDDIGSTITVYATVEFFYNGNPWMTYDTITASCAVGGARIISVEPPADITLTAYYENISDVITATNCELPATVNVTVEGQGTVPMAVEWGCNHYNAAPGAENTFGWWILESEYANYDGNGQAMAGSITVTNVAVGLYSEADFYFEKDNELGDMYSYDKIDWTANKKTEGKIQYRVKNSNGVWSDWMDSTGYEVGNGAAYEGVIEIGNVTLGAGDIEVRIPDNDRYANPDPDNPMIWTNDEEYLFTAVNAGLTGNAKVGEILTANLTMDEKNFPYIAYPEFIKYEVSYKFIGVGETGSETELQNSTAATYTLQQTDVGSKIKVEITVTMVVVDGSASQALPPLTVTMDEKVAATATPTPTAAPTPTNAPGDSGSGNSGGYVPSYPSNPTPIATPTPKPVELPTVPPAPEQEENPQIQGEDGKSGWEAISDEIEATMKAAEDSEEKLVVTVDMNGATKVPKDIFEQIAGKDISVEFILDNGLKWTVDGKSVKAEEWKDIDFAVTFGTDENPLNSIPVKVISPVTGECISVELQLAYSGEFGFEAVLTVDLEEKNAGLYANLFFYNVETEELEFVCSDVIAKDGTADLTFTHASDYLIVLSETSMEPKDEVEVPEEKNPVLKKGYTVQIGAFSREANAKKWEQKGEAIDIPMFIIKDGKYFKVQTDVFETGEEAVEVSKKLAAAGLDNFVLKTERLVTPGEDEMQETPTKPTTPVLPAETDKKKIEVLAKEVIDGKWGNGKERKDRLTEAGHDYREVQDKVNELLR